MTTQARRFGQVFTIVSRTAGTRFLERALPSWIGLLLAAAILFGPTAMQPADVARAAHQSLFVRGGLWAGWLLLATPLTGELLRDRRADFLRAVPAARLFVFASTVIWLLAVQLPFGLLWAAASGPIAGGAALVLGAGTCAAIASSKRSIPNVVAIGGAFVAIAVDASPFATLALAPLLLVSARAAWVGAPERPTMAGAAVRGPAIIALAIAHALRLARSERIAAGRAIAVALAAGGIAALAVRNNGDVGTPAALHRFLAVFAAVSVVAAGAIAAPIRAADTSIDVLLRAGAIHASLRSGARMLTAAAFMLVASLAGVAVARWIVPLSIEHVLAAPALAAILGTAVVELDIRLRTGDGPGRDRGGRIVLLMMVVAIAGASLASALGELAVAVLGAAGLLSFLVAERRGRARRTRRSSPRDSALVVTGVKKRFGGREVLREASLELAPGAIGWLRGENGSGKSTLLKVIAGLLEPDEGEVRAGRIGYAPDAGELPDHLSVGELLALVAALRASSRDAAAVLGVPALLGERLSTLSLGQRRRVAIATALVGDPGLLLLDEPTNGLDAEGLDELARLLVSKKAAGRSVLLASHEGELAPSVADVAWTMTSGSLSAPRAVAG